MQETCTNLSVSTWSALEKGCSLKQASRAHQQAAGRGALLPDEHGSNSICQRSEVSENRPESPRPTPFTGEPKARVSLTPNSHFLTPLTHFFSNSASITSSSGAAAFEFG